MRTPRAAHTEPADQVLSRLGSAQAGLGVAAAVNALDVWHGVATATVIETGIALAIAAVPEALPPVATIALAIGVYRMARPATAIGYAYVTSRENHPEG